MQPLISHSVKATWDAPPDAVAWAVERAIATERYEDAGHPTWSLWRVRGSVHGRKLDLLFDAHSEPGRLHVQFPLGLEVRGELVSRGAGTELVGRATTPGSKWDWPIGIGLALMLALPFLLFASLAGLAACLLVFAATIALFLLLTSVLRRQYLAALPQVEAVLERVGTPAQT